MDKGTKFYGIDVSKNVFDVYNDELGHQQYENNPNGFREFAAQVFAKSHLVI